ncbi:endonuclease domain-containing protein [uncultured Maritalea sp.]|jgi:very-short-patch-repair endonuclease|uniref:endonuclease domain-containing protein n=1 Tax=uncultured Maritalea sp. TaxID=757249 RepID=UPI0026126BC0|nr:endonuclease domain-containing protein [uncultured Maritalea sp.]
MSKKRARELRQNATPPEKEMWKMLRTLRADGFHFRRQVQLGPYYADFVCHSAKLVIEIDGDTHGSPEQMEFDRKRDRFLQRHGYTVLRLTNAEVMKNMEGVFDVVQNALASSPHPNPPHDGGGSRMRNNK